MALGIITALAAGFILGFIYGRGGPDGDAPELIEGRGARLATNP